MLDEYADWEIGYALAELHRLGNIEIVTVGFSEQPVTSMGGLLIHPHIVLSQVAPSQALLFLLSGGSLWEQEYPCETIHMLEHHAVPIAAICAATTVLGHAGLFANRKHTSNSLRYIEKLVPSYASHAMYCDALAVTDKNIITASGLGSVDFTLNILTLLNIATPKIRKMWYKAFKFGEYPKDIDENA